jgi:hypothetical protein
MMHNKTLLGRVNYDTKSRSGRLGWNHRYSYYIVY